MSIMADDIINFESMLKMSYNFLAGRIFLKKKKFKEKKKIVSVALPLSDLAFASSIDTLNLAYGFISKPGISCRGI